MATPRSIEEYLERLPEDQRAILGQLREQLSRLAPDAEETISYGMPTWKLRGRALVYLAAWKAHCTVYPIDDELLAAHAAALAGHSSTKGGLHFSPDHPLPEHVLADLIRRRRAALEQDVGAAGADGG